MDFRDITHTLSKQTKKAKDLALKPISLMTDPLAHLQKKVKKTVFGPDLTIFITIVHDQKLKLLGEAYATETKTIAAALHKAGRSAKKQTAVLEGLKAIRESTKHQHEIDEKTDMLLALLDELQYACRHGLPGELKNGTFQTSRTGLTKEEITVIQPQLSTAKASLKALQKTLDDDLYQALLERVPTATELMNQLNVLKTSFPKAQKTAHHLYRTVLEKLEVGKDIIWTITQKTETLTKLDRKKPSLFGPERTKAKTIETELRQELHFLTTKTFVNRSTAFSQELTRLNKQLTSTDNERQHISQARKTFFTSRQSRAVTLAKDARRAQQGQPNTTKKLLKQSEITLEGMHHLFGSLDGTEHIKQIQLLTQQYHQIETVLKKQRLAVATGYRQTGKQSQLPLVAQQLLVEHRQNFLMDALTLQREKILGQKISRRLVGTCISLLESMQTTLQKSVPEFRKEISSVNTPLTWLTRTFQQQQKTIEKDLTELKAALASAKDELRDTITFRRLVARKRHRYQEYTTGHLAQAHADQLASLIALKQAGLKLLKQKERKLLTELHLAQIALEEQQKTSRLLKTAKQKTTLTARLHRLQQLKDLLGTVHDLIDHIKLQKNETQLLENKYRLYAQHTLTHLPLQEKYVAATAAKLKPSPLRQRVDCSGIKK